MQLPMEAVAPVVGGMGVAVLALWRWSTKLQKRNEDLQKQLLAEKEQKAAIFQELMKKAEEILRKAETKKRDQP